jgi:large subunit ribosomal protein L10
LPQTASIKIRLAEVIISFFSFCYICGLASDFFILGLDCTYKPACQKRLIKNMPKSKVQKQEILRSLEKKIGEAKSIIFAGFNALGVKDNEALRDKLGREQGEYYVAKKTLLTLALKNKGLDSLDTKTLDGKIAAVFSYGDEVAAAKVLDTFRQDKEKADKLYFLGGILEGKLLSKEDVEALAKIPSRQELYAKLVGSINAPVSGFVNALAGNLRNLVNVLKAIEEKK